jgi:N-acetylmuramoyl-L-alanine amidase
MAQALRADAFLSIHADTVLQGDASGASVYVLSAEASDAEAAALAARENRADRLGGLDLPAADEDVARALIALVRGPTMARSQALGGALVAGLSRSVAVLPSAPLRGAGFRVLKAPDVPSALLELGFLSNEADRARLADAAWRAEAAAAVAAALDAWAGAGGAPGG